MHAPGPHNRSISIFVFLLGRGGGGVGGQPHVKNKCLLPHSRSIVCPKLNLPLKTTLPTTRRKHAFCYTQFPHTRSISISMSYFFENLSNRIAVLELKSEDLSNRIAVLELESEDLSYRIAVLELESEDLSNRIAVWVCLGASGARLGVSGGAPGPKKHESCVLVQSGT